MASRPHHDAKAQLEAAWKSVWQTPEGRLALSEFMVATNVYSEIVCNDQVMLAIAVGERNAGARIARMIGLQPVNYVTDAREATDLVGRFIGDTDRY
jgi:hypothetical protein